ncbi:glycosyltransferase family 2 protein [Ekhidna sp.]|uniref:glycosyltransferase family 2 protein n=1 Tax=Ekhidna sp. TaxID=2608089 RepID=UPI0032EC546A
MNISFIVLSFNDSGTLKPLIYGLNDVLSKVSDDYEIIVIDDCSHDGSFDLLKSIKEIDKLIVFQNSTNLNVGGSFQRAVSVAKYEYIGYTDGDHQYEPEDLFSYKEYIGSYDVITGFRVSRKDSFKRRIYSKVFNFLAQQFFRLNLQDVNSALKIFNGAKLKSLIHWDSGAFYDLEILMRLKFDLNASIKEIPITHRKRQFGTAGGFSKRNLINIITNMIDPKFDQYRHRSLLTIFLKKILRISFTIIK